MEPLSDSIRPDHVVGEVNVNAWDKSAMAARVLRERKLRMLGEPSVADSAEQTFRETVQRQTDHAALAHDTQTNLVETKPDFADKLLRKIADGTVGLKPGSKEFTKRYMRGSQAPEVVAMRYEPAGAEGYKMASRAWAVDSDDIDCVPKLLFHKQAGDEMTDDEYRAVCRAQRPMQWDEDGTVIQYAPLHDGREGLSEQVIGEDLKIEHWTVEEREESKQYAVRGLTDGGTGMPGTPPTDHTIVP